MTCRQVKALMEEVLDGEADERREAELQEHFGDCRRCRQTWQAAWQVRSMLRECVPPDPGEEYFEEATGRIMARIGAARTSRSSSGESTVIGSMRYGPLAVRGVGAAALFALSLMLSALVGPRGDAEAVPLLRKGVRPLPHPACAGVVGEPALPDRRSPSPLPSAPPRLNRSAAHRHDRGRHPLTALFVPNVGLLTECCQPPPAR